jgi:hypothetical protein
LAKAEAFAYAIPATLPLHLDRMDWENESRIPIEKDARAIINAEVQTYWHPFNLEGLPVSDSYFNTLCIKDSNLLMFLVLLQNPVTSEIIGKVIFFDASQKRSAAPSFDFKCYAMYEKVDGKLVSSSLKKTLGILDPEIRSCDFNADGKPDFHFKRLLHNGTYNALLSTIITLKDNTLDTLYFCEQPLGPWSEKKDCF